MNKKTLAVSLILLCIVGAVMTAFAVTTSASADSNGSDTSVTTQTIPDDNNRQFGAGNMMDQGFGMGHSKFGLEAMIGIGGNYKVSSEYTDAVSIIIAADSDVANLLSQGYNVTSIRPVITNVIQGDGTVAATASTAIVTLQNGDSGYSIVHVDVTSAKVTYIETTTRTIIDKSIS